MSSDVVRNCMDLERRMTEAERTRACERVEQAGWRPGSAVPAFVWQQVYIDILLERGQRHD